MTPGERDKLIDSLLDSDIDETDFLRLEAEMHIDPEVRQAYYERIKLDSSLQIEAENSGSGTSIESPSASAKFGWVGWAGAFAFALLAGTIGWKIGQDNETVTRRKTELVASGFGVVAEQSTTSWNLNRGDLLPAGPVVLESGIASLELFSGVTLMVEGPAEFEVLSTMELAITRGKFRALTPKPAREFRVRVPQGELANPGAEFAVHVTTEHIDIRSIDGELEWHPVAKPVRKLNNGESLRWSATGEESTTDGEFAKFGELEIQISEQKNARKATWSAFSRKLRDDPRLLAYFPMERARTADRIVIDESPATRDGTIVRSSHVEGRFDGKGGLDFSPMGSRIRVEIPGDHQSLSLMCWVKIDSLDRWYNSLFLTDGHELHEPHWQIMDDGRLFFSVKANEPGKKGTDKHIAFSPPIWTPAQSGKWMHLATVFDGVKMTTAHYVDGKQISLDEIPENMQPKSVRIGDASIGNWSDPTRGNDPNFAVRNLNGTIDEFAIFSAPLPAAEIREIYQAGKP